MRLLPGDARSVVWVRGPDRCLDAGGFKDMSATNQIAIFGQVLRPGVLVLRYSGVVNR